MSYQVVTDEELHEMFEGTGFNQAVKDCPKLQRAQLTKNVGNKYDGYWVGHTAFHMMVEAGLIKDGKPCGYIELTTRGQSFLKQELGVEVLPKPKAKNRGAES